MGEKGERLITLAIEPECHSLEDVQNFFRTLPKKYPKLIGAHIEFEEEQEKTPGRIFVPPGIGGT